MCRVLIEGGCLRSELYQDLNYNLIRILRAFHFSADPVPELDPALHQSNENLQRVVYKPSRATFWASKHVREGPWPSTSLFWASKASEFFFIADPNPVFNLMRIRIQLPKIMRIRIRNSGENMKHFMSRYACNFRKKYYDSFPFRIHGAKIILYFISWNFYQNIYKYHFFPGCHGERGTQLYNFVIDLTSL